MARLSWRSGLISVVALGLAYGLVHAALRLWVSNNIAIDDIKSNVYAQTLELGYIAKQPPLYEWLLWLVQQMTGPTLPSFLVLKYALLTATFAFLYLVAKRIFADPKWAMLAALSPLLLYQIAWNVHEGVTQTIALVCAVAVTTWLFMRLVERGSLGSYAAFGFAAGLGLPYSLLLEKNASLGHDAAWPGPAASRIPAEILAAWDHISIISTFSLTVRSRVKTAHSLSWPGDFGRPIYHLP